MSLTIYWSKEAIETFNQNLDYLERDWDHVVMNKFLDRIEEALEQIKENPQIYPEYKTGIRKCIINEHISLYYYIVNKTRIDIITFWNNWQGSDKLNL